MSFGSFFVTDSGKRSMVLMLSASREALIIFETLSLPGASLSNIIVTFLSATRDLYSSGASVPPKAIAQYPHCVRSSALSSPSTTMIGLSSFLTFQLL